jgi:inorganic pyrophosphatase
VYKALEPGKEVEAARWVGQQAAEDEIEACRKRLTEAEDPGAGGHGR